MIDLIDTHAHLRGGVAADRQAVVNRARAAGVGTIIVPAVDGETAARAVELAEKHDGLYATAGYHPHEASHLTDAALARVEALLDEPKVVAVGEIGLDFYRLHSPREAQIEALARQLALAERHAVPVVIHCRDAWDDLSPVLEPWARRAAAAFAGRPLGVLHYFAGGVAEARRYHEIGFLISIHTSVTHPKAQALREVARDLPLEALVIETDSPYGAPQTQRGRRNEPAFVVEAAKQIAAERGIALEKVAQATTANARRLFPITAGVEGRTATGTRA